MSVANVAVVSELSGKGSSSSYVSSRPSFSAQYGRVTAHRKIQLRSVWCRKIWFGLGKSEFISKDSDMMSQILDLSVHSESLDAIAPRRCICIRM